MIFEAPAVGVVVDEMVSESKIVEFKSGNTINHIDFSIEQGYHRITMSVSCINEPVSITCKQSCLAS